MTVLLTTENGGIPIVPGGTVGGQVSVPGQLQYGDMLTGSGTAACWRELVGWRDTPAASATDTGRPQAHGTYPGSVYGDSLAVTYTILLKGSPDKQEALRALELYLPLDGVERPLVVDEGGGPTMRMARVLQRSLPPMDKAYTPGPLLITVQFLCADPNRYDLSATVTPLAATAGSGGIVYPEVYPLDYGTPGSGETASVTNSGSTPTPLVATFYGPRTNPHLTSSVGWQIKFDLVLGAGEFLSVNTADGTALLNGDADRLYDINPASSPLEACLLPVGTTSLAFSADSGTGACVVMHRSAFL